MSQRNFLAIFLYNFCTFISTEYIFTWNETINQGKLRNPIVETKTKKRIMIELKYNTSLYDDYRSSECAAMWQ